MPIKLRAKRLSLCVLFVLLFLPAGPGKLTEPDPGAARPAIPVSKTRPANPDPPVSEQKPSAMSHSRHAGNHNPPEHDSVPVLQHVRTMLGAGSLEMRKMKMTATGYYAGPESTGKTRKEPQYGITYSGVKVRRAVVSTIAADPKVLPIGSLLYIPGYGYGIVADTGSAIHGNKIDLYFETKQQVYKEWGKQVVQVLLLVKGSGTVDEVLLDRLNEELKAFRLPSGDWDAPRKIEK